MLRAQDLLAPDVVRYWASKAYGADVSIEKIREARDVARDMEKWPDRRLPD